MKRALRLCGLLVSTLAMSWSSAEAGYPTCTRLQSQYPCEVGSIAYCYAGEDLRRCECVALQNGGRWLCFYN